MGGLAQSSKQPMASLANDNGPHEESRKGFSRDSIAVIAAKASNLRADATKLSSSKLSYKFAHPPNGLVELRLGKQLGR